VDKPADEPRSLLRRLLKRADGLDSTTAAESVSAEIPPAAPSSLISPPNIEPTEPVSPVITPPPKADAVPRKRPNTSPIRPPAPESPINTEPSQPIAPRPRSTQTMDNVQQISTVEERLQAEAALESLREKTAVVAAEFADGKLNRAQFVAMYSHYNEKRTIIEKLLARDPGTSAWQSVAKPGHTTFLRAHFEARVLSYAIYQQAQHPGQLITSQGTPTVPAELSNKITAAITILQRTHKSLSAQRKETGNGNWAVFVPGVYTTAIIVFSLEPSARQTTLVQDLHRDFERANRRALERNIFEPDQLVFPHRALFGKSTNKLSS